MEWSSHPGRLQRDRRTTARILARFAVPGNRSTMHRSTSAGEERRMSARPPRRTVPAAAPARRCCRRVDARMTRPRVGREFDPEGRVQAYWWWWGIAVLLGVLELLTGTFYLLVLGDRLRSRVALSRSQAAAWLSSCSPRRSVRVLRWYLLRGRMPRRGQRAVAGRPRHAARHRRARAGRGMARPTAHAGQLPRRNVDGRAARPTTRRRPRRASTVIRRIDGHPPDRGPLRLNAAAPPSMTFDPRRITMTGSICSSP